MGFALKVAMGVWVLLTATPSAHAQNHGGLQGLGAPGALLKQTDPKVLAFEADLLADINRLRSEKDLPPLVFDPRIRTFCRTEAEYAASGDPKTKTISDRIRERHLATYGHRLQFAYGKTRSETLARLQQDHATRSALMLDPPPQIGIGAFYVPAKEPYYQVVMLIALAKDPMAGKPGLSTAQTDKVIEDQSPKFKACYDEALRKNPNTRGTIIFRTVIDADGNTSRSHILTGIEPTLDACILKVVETLAFPKPYKGKPVSLTHPMSFSPPHGEARIGQLSDGQIRGTFRLAEADFKKCYDDCAKDKPELAGTLTLTMIIAKTGEVKETKVKLDEPNDTRLTQCIIKRARALVFPVPKFDGEVEVDFPLDFKPSSFAQ